MNIDLDRLPVTLIHDAPGVVTLQQDLQSATRVAVDTETHDALLLDNGMWAAVRVISLALRRPDGDVAAYVVDMRDVSADTLAPVMKSIAVADGWNVNFDEQVLLLAGCNVGSWRDAMHIDAVLHSGVTGFDFYHSLAHAARKYLGVEMSGKGTTQMSYDATSDLSSEQVRYPGQDAVVTLLVAEHLDILVEQSGLTVPVELEVAARPFILEMTRRGIPFDQKSWQEKVLSSHQEGKQEALRLLADLTGGSEITLFGESDGPTWNPDSDPAVRTALNEWATAAVKKFTGGRLLERTDKLDKTTLKQISHPLTKALLKYRNHAKVLSTYGANLDQYVSERDGRIRPQYKQGGVVATGRLASDKPNAQNFSPQMKAFFRPAPHVGENGECVPRAFVYADLSQAELRVLAQVSGEERMRDLFRLGGDFHARTAADMFGLDMDALKDSDPDAYSNARKKAKGVNFGIPYGLGAAALATNLTVNSGLETTTEEATEALKRYATAYPAVDQWLSQRDSYVKSLGKTPGPVDWAESFRLYELWSAAKPVSKLMRRRLKRPPSMEEISFEMVSDSDFDAQDDADLAERRADHIEQITWALAFDAPVVLRPDGSPWTFESRSATGRRRVFTVPMDSSPTMKGKFEGVITSAMLLVCTSDKPMVAQLRAEFAAEHGLRLPEGVDRVSKRSGEDRREFNARRSAARKSERVACVKEFEGDRKKLKYELLKFMRSSMGDSAIDEYLLPMALDDQVRSLGNRFRNHPIQSLVADVGLQYYAELHRLLPEFRDAFPIQAVHDSIAIECDLAEAPALCARVKQALEDALAFWCPDVPAVADADIRLSLDDADVIEPSDVPAKVAELSCVPEVPSRTTEAQQVVPV